MAFVSIATFIVQVLYIALLYSVYMTLRTWLIWFYMIILGFNVLSGVFSVFLYDGAAFAVYLLILIGYTFMIIKLKEDSAPLRNMVASAEGGYLEPGIRHMINTAREEFGRRPAGDGGNDLEGPRRNTEAFD
jgi:hypothetical protein